MKRLGAMFTRANETEDRMCLCRLLAAESSGLPPEIRSSVVAFFDLVVKWLEVALRPAARAPHPLEIIAPFEGGLLISRVKKEPGILRAIVSETTKRV